MKIEEVMTRNPECLRPDATVREAAQKMKELDVGVIPVLEDDRLLGMITDRDIAIRVVAEGRDANESKLRDCMSGDVGFCFADQSVKEAAQVMEQKQIRRLPILDRDHKLVGIVSLGDLALDTKRSIAGEVLERVSEPAEPKRRVA